MTCKRALKGDFGRLLTKKRALQLRVIVLSYKKSLKFKPQFNSTATLRPRIDND